MQASLLIPKAYFPNLRHRDYLKFDQPLQQTEEVL